MSSAKIAITLDEALLKRLDRLVLSRQFPSRSRALQEEVREKLDGMDHGRLARECAKLEPIEEKQLAEECMAFEFAQWPEY